jgi:hypothetical protein
MDQTKGHYEWRLPTLALEIESEQLSMTVEGKVLL